MERNDFIASIITTAVEGGINYWAGTDQYKWQFKSLGDAEDFARVRVYDAEGDGKFYSIDMPAIEAALVKLREGPVKGLAESSRAHIVGADVTNGEGADIDSDDADIVIQVACFGEVIYG